MSTNIKKDAERSPSALANRLYVIPLNILSASAPVHDLMYFHLPEPTEAKLGKTGKLMKRFFGLERTLANLYRCTCSQGKVAKAAVAYNDASKGKNSEVQCLEHRHRVNTLDTRHNSLRCPLAVKHGSRRGLKTFIIQIHVSTSTQNGNYLPFGGVHQHDNPVAFVHAASSRLQFESRDA